MEERSGNTPDHDDAPVRVLVAEDDDEMRHLVIRVLSDEGYQAIAARDGTEATRILETGEFDIVLSDVRMPGATGMDVLHQAMARHLHQPVILMTAFGTIESAVQAMRGGAYHYLAKPFDIEDLVTVVGGAARKILELRALEKEGAFAGGFVFPIVFRSSAMKELLRMVQDIADSSATVLLTGSSGTGKELLARAIHGLTARREKPFVAVDCNAIPESLLESELFGFRRGAFTGAVMDKQGIIEQANGGTLFLDEIGNLSLPVQAKLLRFLQERTFRRVGDVSEHGVDIRLIAASNRDLPADIQKGAFREDLFYRLSVIHLKLPDLQDRREDIVPLVYFFIRKFNKGYHVDGIRQDAMDLLVGHAWPGNVRQLENVVERAVILRKAGLIQPRDLPDEIVLAQATSSRSLEEMERLYVLRLYKECGGNQSRVARILGINRRTLYRKLRKYIPDFDRSVKDPSEV